MADAAPRFAVGDKVVAARDNRMRMTIAETSGPIVVAGAPVGAGQMYRCTIDEEHAAAHGRGRSARWFREDDLDIA